MRETSPCLALTDDLHGRPGARRRHCVAPMLAFLAAALLLLAPALASADSSSTLTVVGTSDVSDSGLIPNLIQPQFHSAFPQFTFKYIGTASGTAISDAESGSQGASVLIVHAASLENQFVAGGFSAEPFGRAIFTNDFVLAGPSGDPAGVQANGSHDVVQAFADVASAGINGGAAPKATFLSRGGTPGTTVEEHKIWKQVGSLASPPAGLLLCAVNTTNGGGETPIAANNGVTASGQPCPNSGALPTGAQLPPWYVATGLTQGPNVVAANACSGFQSPANTCYVLTDRGTFDYLASGGDPAGAIPNLAIVTRNDSSSAPGGANELTNYFHAYVINPAKPGEQINLPAAQDFVNFLTSPALQAQLKTYLDDTSDAGGAPFVADAAPNITETGIPSVDDGGKPVTVTGSVINAEPGFPALAGKTVTIDEIEGGLPVPVANASATTDSSGNYSITFVPPSSGSYQVSTGQIQQIEDSTLSPVFGDLLSPAATNAVSMSVQGAISISSANPSPGGVVVSGTVAPAAPDANAKVAILARQQGSSGAFTEVGGASLSAGQNLYAVTGALQPGSWQLEASFQDPGQLLAATSGAVNVTVRSATTTVKFKKVKVKNGRLTVSGSLSQAPSAKGAKIELFALRIAKVGKAQTKAKKAIAQARSASVAFRRVGRRSVSVGNEKFTIKAKLKRGYRYLLQLEYVQKGQTSSFSRLNSISVH